MDILWTIISILLVPVGWIFSLILWFLSFLLMPLLIAGVIAAIALRYAWRWPPTRPLVEKMITSLGRSGHKRAKKLLYLITVEPFRVIFRFIGFAMLYSWVNLWWRPKWSPWERAREHPATGKKSAKTKKRK